MVTKPWYLQLKGVFFFSHAFVGHLLSETLFVLSVLQVVEPEATGFEPVRSSYHPANCQLPEDH